MQEIRIKPAVNGWIIGIGCSTFVAVDKEHMLDEIGRYIDNPKDVEKEYMENAKNKDEHPRPDTQEEQPRLPDTPNRNVGDFRAVTIREL